MTSPRDFQLILEKGMVSPSAFLLLAHSPVLQKSSYYFFANVLCLCCGVLHGWLTAASAWPWGAGQGGRRHQVLCHCSGAGCPSPPHKLLGAGWILPLPTCGQLGSARTLHSTMPSVQRKPSGEHRAPGLGKSHRSVQDVCWDRLFLLLCLSQSSWVSLCAPGTVCAMPRGEEAREHPMAWSAETGTAPVLCLGTRAAARQEWDGSSWE